MMKDNEIMRELENILQLEENSLQLDSKLNEIEEWDSMAMLSFMSFARKQFGKRITASDFKCFEVVRDICTFLNEK